MSIRIIVAVAITAATVTTSAYAQGLNVPAAGNASAPPVPTTPVSSGVNAADKLPSPWDAPQLTPSPNAAQTPAVPPRQNYSAAPPATSIPIERLASPDARDIARSIQGNGSAFPANTPPTETPSGLTTLPVASPQPDDAGGTGIVQPMSPSQLEAALASRNGPPLPDAQLAAHQTDASEEADLRRQSALLDLRTDVYKKQLALLGNERNLRIALARSKLPIAVGSPSNAPTDTENSSTPMAGDLPSPGTASGKAAPGPVPVVYSIGGVGSDLTADVLVPYAGAREVRAGSTLPNGLHVVAVDPFAVIVEDKTGNRTSLPMGRSVPASPTTARPAGTQTAAAGQTSAWTR